MGKQYEAVFSSTPPSFQSWQQCYQPLICFGRASGTPYPLTVSLFGQRIITGKHFPLIVTHHEPLLFGEVSLRARLSVAGML